MSDSQSCHIVTESVHRYLVDRSSGSIFEHESTVQKYLKCTDAHSCTEKYEFQLPRVLTANPLPDDMITVSHRMLRTARKPIQQSMKQVEETNSHLDWTQTGPANNELKIHRIVSKKSTKESTLTRYSDTYKNPKFRPSIQQRPYAAPKRWLKWSQPTQPPPPL